jgi:hypothetical protein
MFDIYGRFFQLDGSALGAPFKINDDGKLVARYQADVCIGDSNQFLVVWGDMRDHKPEYFLYEANIYGQLYSYNRAKIGRNFRVNEPINSTDQSPDVSYINGEFQVSWSSLHVQYGFITYVNRWKYSPVYEGKYTSPVLDVGMAGADYSLIYWDESCSENTDIVLQLRTATTLELLEVSPWYGPDDTTFAYTIASGEKIHSTHKWNRYLQCKAFLLTAIEGQSPALCSISIDYLPFDSLYIDGVRLYQAYPNPSYRAATIRYDLLVDTEVLLSIYDILGREVIRLVDRKMIKGKQQVEWGLRDYAGHAVPSGIYIARLSTPGYSKAIKMVLLK